MNRLVVLGGWFLAFTVAGGPFDCGGPKPMETIDRTIPTTETEMIEGMRNAYRYMDLDYYVSLLADDYRFYPDADTRELNDLPEFWDRAQDSLCTHKMFHSPDLIGVKALFTHASTAQENPGRPGTTFIDIADTFLEIELGPLVDFPEGATLLIDGQIQHVVFRRGKTDSDTLETSPTASRLYIVEWRDRGRPRPKAERQLRSEKSTLSSIKAFFCLD
jgi:hypothetical protein